MTPDTLNAGDPVVSHVAPKGAPVPLVFDSPHSGTGYPPSFAPAIPPERLLRTADLFVHELFGAAPASGAHLIHARFPRAFIDPNRAMTDIDPELVDGTWPGPMEPGEKTRLGKGLIWRLAPGNLAIHAKKLPVAEVEARIRDYYLPYHALVADTLDSVQAAFGRAYLVNCHSMKSVSTTLDREGPGIRRPDVVVSDREGAAASPEFVAAIREILKAEGLKVRLNDPFKGAEIVRRHGRPAEGRHAVQIELNRALYMDETRLERSNSFDTLRAMIDRLVGKLAAYCADAP